jgi:hypothetical protein
VEAILGLVAVPTATATTNKEVTDRIMVLRVAITIAIVMEADIEAVQAIVTSKDVTNPTHKEEAVTRPEALETTTEAWKEMHHGLLNNPSLRIPGVSLKEAQKQLLSVQMTLFLLYHLFKNLLRLQPLLFLLLTQQ